MSQKYLVVFLILVVSVKSSCCVKWLGDSCQTCPPNTHLYRNNCLNDIRHCQAYEGFDCVRCSQGYVQNANNTVCELIDLTKLVIPQSGYKTYTFKKRPSQFHNMIVEDSKKRSQEQLFQYKTYFIRQQNALIYRIIFYTDNGFLQNTYATFVSQENFLFMNSTSYIVEDDEEFVYDIEEDPNYETIIQFVTQNYPSLLRTQILDVYKKQTPTHTRYRALLDDPFAGRIQLLKIQLSKSQKQQSQEEKQKQQTLFQTLINSFKIQKQYRNTQSIFFQQYQQNGITLFQIHLQEQIPNGKTYIIKFQVNQERQKIIIKDKHVVLPEGEQTQNIQQKIPQIIPQPIPSSTPQLQPIPQLIPTTITQPILQQFELVSDLKTVQVQQLLQFMDLYFGSSQISDYQFVQLKRSKQKEDKYRISYQKQGIITQYETYLKAGFNPSIVRSYNKSPSSTQQSVQYELTPDDISQNQTLIIIYQYMLLVSGMHHLQQPTVLKVKSNSTTNAFQFVLESPKETVIFQVYIIKSNNQIHIQSIDVTKNNSRVLVNKVYNERRQVLTRMNVSVQDIEQAVQSNKLTVAINKIGISYRFNGNRQLPKVEPKTISNAQSTRKPSFNDLRTVLSEYFKVDESEIRQIKLISSSSYFDVSQLSYQVTLVDTYCSFLIEYYHNDNTIYPIQFTNKNGSYEFQKGQGIIFPFTPFYKELQLKVKELFGNRITIKQVLVDVNGHQRIFIKKYNQQGIQHIQVILNNNQVVRLISKNGGYYQISTPNPNSRIQQFVSKLLPGGIVLLRKIRQNRINSEVQYYVQYKDETIYVKLYIAYTNIYVIYLNELPSQLKRINAQINNNITNYLNDITTQPQFQQAQRLLMNKYSHYLHNAQIIRLQKNERQSAIQYRIIYKTSSLYYQATLLYNYQRQQAEVRSLNMTTKKRIKPFVMNCKQYSKQECSQCKENYHIHNNKCYEKVKGCRIQSGKICLQCQNKFRKGYVCSF